MMIRCTSICLHYKKFYTRIYFIQTFYTRIFVSHACDKRIENRRSIYLYILCDKCMQFSCLHPVGWIQLLASSWCNNELSKKCFASEMEKQEDGENYISFNVLCVYVLMSRSCVPFSQLQWYLSICLNSM